MNYKREPMRIMKQAYEVEEEKIELVTEHWLESIYYIDKWKEWHLETAKYFDNATDIYRWCFKEKLPELVFESIPEAIRKELLSLAKICTVSLPIYSVIKQEVFVIDIAKFEEREAQGTSFLVCVEPKVLQHDDIDNDMVEGLS